MEVFFPVLIPRGWASHSGMRGHPDSCQPGRAGISGSKTVFPIELDGLLNNHHPPSGFSSGLEGVPTNKS